jgi:hypothetical protein
VPAGRTKAPQETLAGWKQTDVGGALPGGLHALGEGRFELFGGGADIWGAKDQFRFLYRPVEGDFELETALESVEDLEDYTKAGLMVRADVDPSSPFVLLSVFPSGDVQFAHRDRAGADAKGGEAIHGPVSDLRLRIVRRGGVIETYAARGTGAWTLAGSTPDRLPKRVYVGAVALSHDNSQLAKIVYRDLRVK